MNTHHSWKKGVSLGCILMLSACGGSGLQTAGIDGSGAPTPGISAGPITGFGSILQNGRRYIVDDATQITIDDNPSSSDLLDVGEFVVIRSVAADQNGNPIAASVTQETLLKGQISSINASTMQFVALGQTILVRASTLIDPLFSAPGALSDFDRLETGDSVEISGFIASDGSLVATFIGFEDSLSEARLIGDVSALNTDARTFQINNLTVDYGLASLENFDQLPLDNGQRVRVRGTMNGPVLEATEVKRFDSGFEDLDDNAESEIKGIVTAVISSGSFEVNGVPVTITTTTGFEGGNAAQIITGAIVEVEGVWSGSAIIAEQIEFEQEETIRIAGLVDAVSIAAADQNSGTLQIFGLTLNSGVDTAYEDDSDADITLFGIDDLQPGDFVELSGYADGTDIHLSQVVREDASLPLEVELQGILTQSTPNSAVQILGVNVDVSGSEFQDANDNTLDAAQFFNLITIGSSILQVSGSYNGSMIIAEEIEIETGQ